MARKKSKNWTIYGDGIQVVDIVFEVRELDRLKLGEGRDTQVYKDQHKKTVNIIKLYNNEVPGGRGSFSMSISKARHLIQLGTGSTTIGEVQYG